MPTRRAARELALVQVRAEPATPQRRALIALLGGLAALHPDDQLPFITVTISDSMAAASARVMYAAVGGPSMRRVAPLVDPSGGRAQLRRAPRIIAGSGVK